MSDFIRVGGTAIRTYETNNTNAVFTYKILAGGASPDGSFTGTTFTGPGFTFNKSTKVLQINAAAPSSEIYNFLFIVEGIDNNDEPAKRNANKREAAIRIHIHAGLAEAWLTPSPLTAYVGIGDFRASIFVRYTDGIISELGCQISESGNSTENVNITHHPSIRPNCPSRPPLINQPLDVVWSCPSSPALINGQSGQINPTAAGNFDIQAVLSNTTLGINVTATGTVRVTTELSATSSIRASLVTAGNCPGFSKIGEVPNILFIPDGFLAADQAKFDRIVDNYVQKLMTGHVTAPFKYLSGSINFWKVFLPSRQAGATTKKALYPYTQNSNRYGWGLYTKKPENMTTSSWSVRNLYYYVGLPVYRHSLTSNTYNGSSPMTTAQIRSEWKAITSLSDPQVDAIPESKINSWRKKAERKLPEELDTSLGIFINNYDAIKDGTSYNGIRWNPKRMTRERLNTFLAALKDDSGNLIGNHFLTTRQNTGQTDPAGSAIEMMPKDFDNMVVLTAANQGRANNGWGYSFLDLNDTENGIRIQENGAKTTILVENTVTSLNNSQKATLTHEICHSFGLEDEYGETPSNDSYNGKFIDHDDVDDWQYTVYDADPNKLGPEEMDWSGNVQARQDLLILESGSSTNVRLHGAKIKWRYHRIEKCGVLTAVPAASGNRFTLTLRTGQAAQFAVDDPVYLRKRRSRTLYINGNYKRIEPIHGYTNTRPASITPTTIYTLIPTRSDEMVVKAVNASADQIEIEPAPSTAVLHVYFNTMEDWEEIIVYKPKAVPEGVSFAGYRYAELISHKVLEYFYTSSFAFNAKKDSSAGNALKEIIDKNPVQESRILGELVPSCSSRKKQIVALYSNGNQYHGHVYHSTGQCLMRTQYHDGSIKGLCEVCKYILVNMIDPSKHKEINENYSDKIYPS